MAEVTGYAANSPELLERARAIGRQISAGGVPSAELDEQYRTALDNLTYGTLPPPPGTPPPLSSPGGFLVPRPGTAGYNAIVGGQVVGGVMYNPATGASLAPTGATPSLTTPVPTGVPPVTTPPVTPPGMGGNNPPPGPLPWEAAPPVNRPDKDASVRNQITGLLSAGSPLLTQARTGAAQAANARGLLNSSIAAGAGEEAALRVALPIASQDASQIHAENLAGQSFRYTGALQGSQIAANAALQDGSIASQERLSAAAIAANAALQTLDATSRERINANDIIGRQRLQDSLAATNVTASDRNNAQTALLTAQGNYANTIASLNSNAQMPSAERAAQMESAFQFLRASQNVIEQLYSIRVDWPTTSGAATVPPPAVG